MKVILAVSTLGLLLGSGLASLHGLSFDDVPPCHWAAEAVADTAALGLFVGFPRDDAYESVNALRQVFEGLRCDDPGWSLRFVRGAPVAFGLVPVANLVGFDLEPVLLERRGDDAVVAFALTAVLEEAGARRTVTREGTVRLTRDGGSWWVPYDELAALELSLFP